MMPSAEPSGPSLNNPSAYPSAHPLAHLASLGLPRANPVSAALLATPGLELSFNARGALLAAFREIARQGRRKVLLPAFHCPSAISPALLAGLTPVYYRIRPDLGIDTDDVLRLADRDTAAILLIHFFGFAPDLQPLAALAALGIQRVEDCSHAYVAADSLGLAGSPLSDYRVFSFWKIAPSGVGGGLWRRQPLAAAARAAAPASARLRNYKQLLDEAAQRPGQALLRALLGGVDGLRNGLRDSLRHGLRKPPPPAAVASTTATPPPPLLERGEAYYPMHASLADAAMPRHVRRIIAAADLPAIVGARRANYLRYQAALPRLQPLQALAPALPAATCPWVFPVLLDDRAQWDHRLRAAGVALHTFGIYLHSSLFASGAAAAVRDARYLADRVLCLSIHPDLGVADIDRSIAQIAAILSPAHPP